MVFEGTQGEQFTFPPIGRFKAFLQWVSDRYLRRSALCGKTPVNNLYYRRERLVAQLFHGRPKQLQLLLRGRISGHGLRDYRQT